jgi:GDP-L-fucose synthase
MSTQNFYKGKNILVAGGTGTLGVMTTKRLMSYGANVTVASIDSEERVKNVFGDSSFFKYANFKEIEDCLRVTKDMDMVFNLVAIKGCTQTGGSRVAEAYMSFIVCNTNLTKAVFENNVERYMFVGSIGEYPNFKIRKEEDMWSGPPQANDRFMGIAKRAGETQMEAYLEQYGWKAGRVCRLANVFGPYDDFDPRTCHCIPALINKCYNNDKILEVSGDGTAVRDFIYLEDAVDGMLEVMYKAPPCSPVNIGSGNGYSIKEVAESIIKVSGKDMNIKWNIDGPTGDQIRILDIQKARDLFNYSPKLSLMQGLKKTYDWYVGNKEVAEKRGKELHGK